MFQICGGKAGECCGAARRPSDIASRDIRHTAMTVLSVTKLHVAAVLPQLIALQRLPVKTWC